MHETERLSALIGDIYDAAVDPSLWIDVLETTADYIGGSAASLYWQDPISRTGSATYTYGMDPTYVRLYGRRSTSSSILL